MMGDLAHSASNPPVIKTFSRKNKQTTSTSLPVLPPLPSETTLTLSQGPQKKKKISVVLLQDPGSPDYSPTNSPSKKRPRSSYKVFQSKKSKTNEDKQFFLDFGQKNFDSKKCEECGMVYAPGLASDEALHLHFHKDFSKATSFSGWKSENVVKSFSDGSRIVKIAHTDPPAHKKKMEEVKSLVDRELSFAENMNAQTAPESHIMLIYVRESKIIGCVILEKITEAYPVIPLPEEKKEVQANNIPTNQHTSTLNTEGDISVIKIPSNCEPIVRSESKEVQVEKDTEEHKENKQPNPLITTSGVESQQSGTEDPQPAKSEKTEDTKPTTVNNTSNTTTRDCNKSKKRKREDIGDAETTSQEENVVCSKIPTKAILGISRVWVSKSDRRKRVATKLLDAARSSLYYNCVIEKNMVAFSQPTAEGRRLASSYLGNTFLVY